MSYVCLQESIRGCDVFLIQPTCPPVNDHLMELMVMIDACKRASARSITAVRSFTPHWPTGRAGPMETSSEQICTGCTVSASD
jgi:ribose-phosphate pyrophosphokinase